MPAPADLLNHPVEPAPSGTPVTVPLLRDLTTNQKGAIAETAIAHAAVRAGIAVLTPLVEARYDLVFDLGSRFVRVQCKWARHVDDVVIVSCRTSRRGPNGFLHGGYTADEVDAFAAFSFELNRCFFLPVDRVDGRHYVELRLAPTRNRQRRGVNWADDYDFERLDWAALTGP